jgi:hypothetical protein
VPLWTRNQLSLNRSVEDLNMGLKVRINALEMEFIERSLEQSNAVLKKLPGEPIGLPISGVKKALFRLLFPQTY